MCCECECKCKRKRKRAKRLKLEEGVYAVDTSGARDNAEDVKRLADRMSEQVDSWFDPSKLGSASDDA